MTLSYPPPFQDLKTLAQHCCLSPDTIERMVEQGRFPAPRKNKCGKRLWVWEEVYEHLKKPDDDGLSKGGPIYEATRRHALG